MSVRKVVVLLVHAFVGWALCAATMGIGMAVAGLQTALTIHAIGAPVFFAAVSSVYFSRFNYTSPLPSATVFVGFVMVVDFFIVALLINRSLAMFGSLIGTWIPFALIFGSTLITGALFSKLRARSYSKGST
jgi:hypothetical protein